MHTRRVYSNRFFPTEFFFASRRYGLCPRWRHLHPIHRGYIRRTSCHAFILRFGIRPRLLSALQSSELSAAHIYPCVDKYLYPFPVMHSHPHNKTPILRSCLIHFSWRYFSPLHIVLSLPKTKYGTQTHMTCGAWMFCLLFLASCVNASAILLRVCVS